MTIVANAHLAKQMSFPSAMPTAIASVETALEELRQELEIRDDVFFNMMVAITEAVNNAAIHGNNADATKSVHIEFAARNPYILHVRIRDEGTGFDPDSLPDPTAPENLEKPTGRGVFLMRQLADEIHFEDDGRCVEMRFNI
jgi:serine/threonine-protein kinase RsbW